MKSEGCLFCKIVAGETPSEKVYEDESSIAIMDINPLAPGHVVVLPREHGETILEVSDESVAAAQLATKKVTAAIDKALAPDGFTIGINHKIGQAVPHLHIHILPRWRDDGGGNIHSIVHNKPDQEISEIAAKIRAKL